MSYRRVAAREEVWEGEMCSVRVGKVPVLLLSLDGRVFAYEDRCAHLGQPLSDGQLEDGVITCAAHNYQYDARTGQGVNPRSACLRRFSAKADAGAVWVDVEAVMGETGTLEPERVGPVLEASDAARRVVAAIRELNPAAEVIDRGAYLRVLVPGRCVLTRRAVEEALGRPFALPGDLELLMPSFKGRVSFSDDEVVWEAR